MQAIRMINDSSKCRETMNTIMLLLGDNLFSYDEGYGTL